MNILNFGSCNVDYVYSLDRIVRSGETLSSLRREVFAGGKGLNQSIAIARAGCTVYHAGFVGEDGAFLVDMLKESGVDTRFLQRVSGPSGHAIIQVAQSGENAIFIHAGANALFTKEYIDSVFAHFSAGDLVVLQNEITGNDYIIDCAARKGMRVILNPSPINENVLKLDYEKVDCIVINEHEGEALSGEREPQATIASLKKAHPHLNVLLTLGQSGCLYDLDGTRYSHRAFEVKALDTTAAGDTFTGYFISALAQGRSPEQTLREASAAAAISVSRMGAAPSIPTFEEVQQGLRKLTVKPSAGEKRFVEKVDEYIGEDLRTASLSGLAKALGYSCYYTGKLVRDATGVNFSAYLIKKRTEKAAHLLSNTDLPVTTIIHEVGYNNENFFRVKFKELYGCSPLQFRKNAQKGKNEK